MKITVDRTNDSEGNLVFTITAKEIKQIDFPVEKNVMSSLSACKKIINDSCELTRHVDSIQTKLDECIENTCFKLMDRIKFSIRNDLEPKFKAMCQEIYNAIYDAQEGSTKQWLHEFDPQKTRYYFDNDRTVESDYEFEGDCASSDSLLD